MRRSMICILFLIVILSLNENQVQAEPNPLASVFDVKQGKVVKVLPLTPELEASIMEVLQSSPIHFKGFSMEPQAGIVLHVPFAEPVFISHELYPTAIREIYLFLEPDKKLRALIFFATIKLSPIIVDLNEEVNHFMSDNKQLNTSES